MGATRWPYAWVAAAYAVLCALLWPLPVLGLLHVESSAVVAGVGFFASGLAALALFRRGAALGPVLLRLEALLALPLGLLTLSLLWRPNCGYLQGLLLFALFAPPSVALAVALAFALDGVRGRVLGFVGIGVLVAALPVAYDLGLHPQLYTYNHVWGGVLGPIYDAELAVRPGLFFFRALTLLWAAWLGLLGTRARIRRRAREDERAEGQEVGGALLGLTLLLGAAYLAAPWLGFNTPAWRIQEHLGGHLATPRFDVYFDPGATPEGRVAALADEAAYRYRRLADTLGLSVPERIAIYLYPDPETKAALTGARETSVAPVWLPRPQVHLLESAAASLGHELVHVFSREFGMPLLRASPLVGLVEGVAVALSPPDGLPPLAARVAAAARLQEEVGAYDGGPAEAVAAQLRPLGLLAGNLRFWTGRGAVSYATMGSFVASLLEEYGPEPLRAVYARGDFEAAYGQPVEALAEAWEAALLAAPPDPEAEALVLRRFTRPSLVETRCPHFVPPAERHLRAATEALREGDEAEAYRRSAAAVEADPSHPRALAAWGALALARGETEPVIERIEHALIEADTLAEAVLWSRLADAQAVAGNRSAADSAYARALEAYAPYQTEARMTVRLKARLPAEALRVFLGGTLPAERAEALAAFEAPEARLLAARLWLEAEAYAQAQAELEALDGDAGEAEALRLAWLARAALYAGDRVSAAEAAERAAGTFRARGETGAASVMNDLAARLWWTILSDDPVLGVKGEEA